MTERCVGYVRVSTDEQVRDGWNLNADRERIGEIAAAQGWDLIEVHDDEGRQGDDPDRPGLLAMLATLDECDVIVMRSMDRLSRDMGIYAMATTAIQHAGVRVETFTGPVDLASPEGELSGNVLAAIARFEKRQIGVRVRQAKAARAKAGGHPGGKRPYGYALVDTGRNGSHDKPIRELRPDPFERTVVVRMFEMAEATSQRQIARILNAEGIPASKGGRWTQSTVARVLGSPLYVGKIRRTVNGAWELHKGQHPAIVDEDLWKDVNKSRATPERRVGGRPLGSAHICTRGLLRCSCGSAMIPVASYEDRPEVYKCIGRRDHGPEFCRQSSVRRETVDEALLTELTSRYFDLDGTRDRLRDRLAQERPMAGAAVEDAERELLKVNADARLARIKRGWQEDVLDDDEYRSQVQEVESERQAAQAAVEQARTRVAAIEATGSTTDAEEALLRHLADLRQLVCGTVEQARDIEALRTVVRQLFERVTLVRWTWDTVDEIQAAGITAGRDGDLFLIPKPRAGVIDWAGFPKLTINQVPVPGEVTTPRCR